MPVAGLLPISVYEAKGGGIEGEDYMVLIGIPKRSEGNIILSSTVDETWDEFEKRVEVECLKAFGELPRDWAAERA